MTLNTGVMAAENTAAITEFFFFLIRPVKLINHIQNKCLCLHNICVFCVYLYVYINTHTCMYIFNIYII